MNKYLVIGIVVWIISSICSLKEKVQDLKENVQDLEEQIDSLNNNSLHYYEEEYE